MLCLTKYLGHNYYEYDGGRERDTGEVPMTNTDTYHTTNNNYTVG